jgi:hypothetical protein
MVVEMEHGKQRDLLTVKGLITPAAWDEKGNVVGIVISAFNEVEYAVDQSGKGEELFAFLRKKVVVTGEVRNENEGKKIRIRTYTLQGLEPCLKPRTA